MTSDIGMPTHHYWTIDDLFYRCKFESTVVEVWEDGQWKYFSHRINPMPAPVLEYVGSFAMALE